MRHWEFNGFFMLREGESGNDTVFILFITILMVKTIHSQITKICLFSDEYLPHCKVQNLSGVRA